MANLTPVEGVEAAARQAQIASRSLREATSSTKDALLLGIADALEAAAPQIIEANA